MYTIYSGVRLALQEIGIFPTPKNVEGSEKYIGKGSLDAVLDVGTNVGGSESG